MFYFIILLMLAGMLVAGLVSILVYDSHKRVISGCYGFKVQSLIL